MHQRSRLMAMLLTATLASGAIALDVKSLSADEQSALLAGRGMGMARPAELNGYPGPAHVLELALQLELSAAQLEQTRELFARMQEAAQADGAALIEAERRLDALYASKTATVRNVRAQLGRIERIRAHLRGIHLDAHLEQAALLTQDQRARYAELRGYSDHSHAGH